MDMKLAENIRIFRKQRSLTQEKLAEVLGVTTGAVHKWEAGMSIPELALIVDMADFFDVSVDALLGYQMKDNHIDTSLRRINDYCRTRNPEALVEAEKALKKYPNSFEVVHTCARVYLIMGSGANKEDELHRALELLNQSRLLVSQNRNPELNEFTIYGEMAEAYLLLGDCEKGVEIMKDHNLRGMFSDSIGVNLALYLNRTDEAKPFLAQSLLRSVATLVNTVFGYAIVYFSQGNYDSAKEVILWGTDILKGLKKDAEMDVLDKTHCLLLALLANAQIRTGNVEEATDILRKINDLVNAFDASPDYEVSLRFTETPEKGRLYDSMGSTAAESVESILTRIGAKEVLEIWKGLRS